ncbi:hypothetical protein BX616_002764 [Lobosporangium transversale]|uniref:Uncharacterized protein n=1 Tax=Lobosporangium transversale TaxID=64571 RepID=A0A1Y2GCD1_9FUNG|nr:hypothetical protein BCR41DRAFT_399839 [Lobosporangium transversale]KAF9916804.1 hypothetical protein BX616_002764 [Lobosporangium transversale]ORZ06980.1 hypothetical protein BCR41DRAFT_399839 [Lobosporangium transversale]|eukprot:XP_021877776.1 hypothetical protein BCR41DRAFT_399839 [Lobosporangium transversale]
MAYNYNTEREIVVGRRMALHQRILDYRSMIELVKQMLDDQERIVHDVDLYLMFENVLLGATRLLEIPRLPTFAVGRAQASHLQASTQVSAQNQAQTAAWVRTTLKVPLIGRPFNAGCGAQPLIDEVLVRRQRIVDARALLRELERIMEKDKRTYETLGEALLSIDG